MWQAIGSDSIECFCAKKESLLSNMPAPCGASLDGNSSACARLLDAVGKINPTLNAVLRLCTMLAYTDNATEKFTNLGYVLDIGNLLGEATRLRTSVNEL